MNEMNSNFFVKLFNIDLSYQGFWKSTRFAQYIFRSAAHVFFFYFKVHSGHKF